MTERKEALQDKPVINDEVYELRQDSDGHQYLVWPHPQSSLTDPMIEIPILRSEQQFKNQVPETEVIYAHSRHNQWVMIKARLNSDGAVDVLTGNEIELRYSYAGAAEYYLIADRERFYEIRGLNGVVPYLAIHHSVPFDRAFLS